MKVVGGVEWMRSFTLFTTYRTSTRDEVGEVAASALLAWHTTHHYGRAPGQAIQAGRHSGREIPFFERTASLSRERK
jgi:hypothetical protein